MVTKGDQYDVRETGSTGEVRFWDHVFLGLFWRLWRCGWLARRGGPAGRHCAGQGIGVAAAVAARAGWLLCVSQQAGSDLQALLPSATPAALGYP